MEDFDIFNLDNESFVKQEVKKDSDEEGLYKPYPELGKDGIYKSLIRFLPNVANPKKSKVHQYYVWLKDPVDGKNFKALCPSTVGKKSILKDLFWKLKNSASAKDQELSKLTIKEPFKFILKNGDHITMRAGRVKDLILGIQVSTRMFAPKVRKIKNTYKANMKIEDLEEWRREEIEKLEIEKIKKAIEITKSQTLLTKNGKPFANEEEKINYYRDIDISDTKNIDSYMELIAFGLRDEREVTCEHCGKTERRSLHLEFSPLEFLPTNDNKRDSTVSKISRHTIGNFHFTG